MTTTNNIERAEQLNKLLKAGELAGVYQLLKPLSAEEANHTTLYAGFPCIGPKDRSFWTYTQSMLARACRVRQTGFEYREGEVRAA